jgi:hypothetical protein
MAMGRHQNNRIDSSGEILNFVQGLLNRHEVSFDKVIFLRPLKKLAHEWDQALLSHYCQIKPADAGKCYVMISENLLEGVESSNRWFLKDIADLPEWKSPMAFYLLVEIAHYKQTLWSNNRCERWALNELCSTNHIH